MDPVLAGLFSGKSTGNSTLDNRLAPTLTINTGSAPGYGVPEGFSYNDAPAAPAPVVDPYAQWGGQAQFNQYKDQYNTGLNNVRGTATDAFGALKSNLQGSADNLFGSIRTGQQGIDTSRANNELNRMNGIQDILGYVRSGMRQGISRLSNGNALESSAAGALSNAYNQVGSTKSRSVNNQAAIGGNRLDQSQNELNNQKQTGITDFHRVRDSQVATISSDLRAKLTALDQQAASLSLPDRIGVDAEKQRLIDQGLGQLAEVDNWLNNQLATVNPQNQDQVIAQANNLRSLGTATPNPFDLGGTMQAQVQNGAPIDQLPLYTTLKRRQ